MYRRSGSLGYLSVEFASSEAIVEYLVATEMVAILVKQFRYFLHIDSIVEWRGISNLTLVGRDLGGSTRLLY